MVDFPCSRLFTVTWMHGEQKLDRLSGDTHRLEGEKKVKTEGVMMTFPRLPDGLPQSSSQCITYSIMMVTQTFMLMRGGSKVSLLFLAFSSVCQTNHLPPSQCMRNCLKASAECSLSCRIRLDERFFPRKWHTYREKCGSSDELG